MHKKLRALAAVGALTAALATGCGADNEGLPEPGSEAKEWCFADGWIDRASYVYRYWTGENIPGPEEAKKAMSYGSRLMSQYQDDRQAGDLPADLSNDELTAWVVNLATVQQRTPVTTSDAGADEKVMDSYIDEVHAACR
ncbi:hypothetical protein [Streptomyces luteogriseus]|uniref:hypothetical protein n=1 Tax=Streptomyces luteogriseus TaxID=68233 RepID=UPI0037A34B9D